MAAKLCCGIQRTAASGEWSHGGWCGWGERIGRRSKSSPKYLSSHGTRFSNSFPDSSLAWVSISQELVSISHRLISAIVRLVSKNSTRGSIIYHSAAVLDWSQSVVDWYHVLLNWNPILVANTLLYMYLEYGYKYKVEPSITVKISNCSSLETGFSLTKNTHWK